MQHKVANLPRVVRMALVHKAVTDTADAVAKAALSSRGNQVQRGSDEDKRTRAQLEMPMRFGGMGLQRMPPAEGAAACCPSAALANVAMVGASEQL